VRLAAVAARGGRGVSGSLMYTRTCTAEQQQPTMTSWSLLRLPLRLTCSGSAPTVSRTSASRSASCRPSLHSMSSVVSRLQQADTIEFGPSRRGAAPEAAGAKATATSASSSINSCRTLQLGLGSRGEAGLGSSRGCGALQFGGALGSQLAEARCQQLFFETQARRR